MKKSKVITIDDSRITVHEIIVEDLLQLIEANTTEVRARIDEYLPKCTDLTLARLKAMAPSEIKLVWDAFREVNDVFFSAITSLGIHDAVLTEVKTAIVEEMNKKTVKKESTAQLSKTVSLS